jgi:AraC-like DNA-binding protein
LVFEKVGYENHSSFTQAFKQQFNITPREYQEQKLTR